MIYVDQPLSLRYYACILQLPVAQAHKVEWHCYLPQCVAGIFCDFLVVFMIV